ncbi:hypothetical protein ACQEWB_48935 [Streptomyces sp. CA-249302]|uniref:hypothetical protein n=1 Tax=Streptomyces sp. CA-249302 TaxID=3240058 RepID=UPI003D91569F
MSSPRRHAAPHEDETAALLDIPGARLPGAVGAADAAKFAGPLGEIVSELAVSGTSSFPIEPFRADRPALKAKGFVPIFSLKG